MELFEVKNLTYYYPEKNDAALVDVNLKIDEGEFILLMGASGCGKSTLLRVLAGLVPSYHGGAIGGEVRYNGLSLGGWGKRDLAREVGLVFQDPEQQLVMTSVEQEIAFGLENLGLDPAEMRRRVAEILTLFDLTASKNRFYHLSLPKPSTFLPGKPWQ
jgi:energy-coupling factor transporter ATP-binding protein EcfA2